MPPRYGQGLNDLEGCVVICKNGATQKFLGGNALVIILLKLRVAQETREPLAITWDSMFKI